MRLDFETALEVPDTAIPVHATTGTEEAKVRALNNVPGSEVWPTLENEDTGRIFGVDYIDGCPTTTSSASCEGTWFSNMMYAPSDAQSAEPLAGPTLAMAQDVYDDSMTAEGVNDVTFGAIVATGGAPAPAASAGPVSWQCSAPSRRQAEDWAAAPADMMLSEGRCHVPPSLHATDATDGHARAPPCCSRRARGARPP